MVDCYSSVTESPGHCVCVWKGCAIFSSVLLITDLFGFYLCSFLFLLPHGLTHLFCCWCPRRMSLEVSVRGWSHRSWDPGNASQGRAGALGSKTHCRGTRAVNHECTALCCCYYCSVHKSKVLFVLRFSLKDLPVLS